MLGGELGWAGEESSLATTSPLVHQIDGANYDPTVDHLKKIAMPGSRMALVGLLLSFDKVWPCGSRRPRLCFRSPISGIF